MKQVVQSIFLAVFLSFLSGLSIAADQAVDDTASSQIAVDTVNINSATAEMLASHIQGIGLKKAQAIVLWRESNGPFQSVDDLLNVKGIGTATLSKNRNIIRIE